MGKAIGLIFTTFALFMVVVHAQYPESTAFKQLNVEQGLPQSFVSGLVQDSTGFVWIGTRDGLARYDGRKFKTFIHKQGDTTSLANNTISSLFLDTNSSLWILYETGDIDLLNTRTEKLTHFSSQPLFNALYGVVKVGHSIAEDGAGNILFLANNGGLFKYTPGSRQLQFFSDTLLGLAKNKIVGITSHKGNIVLVTDTALVTLNTSLGISKSVAYSFQAPHLYNAGAKWKDAYALFRKNGEVIIQDEGRLLVYIPQTNSFKVVPLPGRKNMLNTNIILDSSGQVLIAYNSDVFILTNKNELQVWKPKATNPVYGFKSMLIDKSGVLWLGGNGSGIQLHDLRPSGLTSAPYKKYFHEDLLRKYLLVPQKEIAQTFLTNINSYYFRWLDSRNGKFWFSWASNGISKTPQVCYYQNGHIVQPQWHYTDTSVESHINIGAMAISSSGKLWGVDFYLRPVFFDTLLASATVYPPVGKLNTENTYSISSMLIDGEDDFWISTSFDGLFHYNRATGKSVHFYAANNADSLPTNQLMNMVADPVDKNVIWMGSLGGGLLRFDKQTGKCRSFTIRDGLPNNTVYAVLFDARGLLWCSSNRGIFSFNREDGTISSFTSKDGLPCDEFNRYHYFRFADGRLAFGGIDGYTVFDPLKIANDSFQPAIALTGISINNSPVDYGNPSSPFNQSINSLQKIVLPYNQNFLSFEMAALQFNITEKLQYRYMLKDFDKTWINTGSNNIASYTNIPPGKYELLLNATNTAGRWSSHIKRLEIIITPPFWKTAWFILLMFLLAAVLVYYFITRRINLVRKEEQQKAEFERQATELKAQALRAQMNPHFIFNCLNSIKSLIQDDNRQQAVLYLTTFSKLIRNQLNNTQQEISLQAELDTCKLYGQMEALRFGSSIICEFNIQDGLDLFSLQVPPLILQPFMENAIWHGILPNKGGKVTISVKDEYSCFVCSVEDNGIGRALAMRNKSQTNATYESKGMKLVKNRLELYNTIHNRGGSIEVVDKKDKDGNGKGTLVIIRFKKET